MGESETLANSNYDIHTDSPSYYKPAMHHRCEASIRVFPINCTPAAVTVTSLITQNSWSSQGSQGQRMGVSKQKRDGFLSIEKQFFLMHVSWLFLSHTQDFIWLNVENFAETQDAFSQLIKKGNGKKLLRSDLCQFWEPSKCPNNSSISFCNKT